MLFNLFFFQPLPFRKGFYNFVLYGIQKTRFDQKGIGRFG